MAQSANLSGVWISRGGSTPTHRTNGRRLEGRLAAGATQHGGWGGPPGRARDEGRLGGLRRRGVRGVLMDKAPEPREAQSRGEKGS